MQVNIDFSQFLYHEVFGKLPNDHHPPANHLPLHPVAPPPHGPPLHHHPAANVVSTTVAGPHAASSSSAVHDVGMVPIMTLANGQLSGPPPPPSAAGPPAGSHGGHPQGAAGQAQAPPSLDQKPDPATMMPPPGTELGEIKYSADMESQNCDICGKSFQYRYQLIVHRRYHIERKPFTCQVRSRRDLQVRCIAQPIGFPLSNKNLQLERLSQ